MTLPVEEGGENYNLPCRHPAKILQEAQVGVLED